MLVCCRSVIMTLLGSELLYTLLCMHDVVVSEIEI